MALVLSARPSSAGVRVQLGIGALSLFKSEPLPCAVAERAFVSESTRIADVLQHRPILRKFFIKIGKWDEIKRNSGVSSPAFASRSLGRESHLPPALSCDSHLSTLKKIGCLECSGRGAGAVWTITDLGRSVCKFLQENPT